MGPDVGRRRLTPREREVALLFADGLALDVIGQRISLSPTTVANYLHRIQLRLGLSSRADIAAWVDDRRTTEDGSGRSLRRACQPGH
jgi:non-specific serine/threonine protein kinase